MREPGADDEIKLSAERGPSVVDSGPVAQPDTQLVVKQDLPSRSVCQNVMLADEDRHRHHAELNPHRFLCRASTCDEAQHQQRRHPSD